MQNKIRIIPRRNFFGKLGKGIAGFLVITALPLDKIIPGIKKQNELKKTIKVFEHPLAVKRNRKG
ncbi:MAG: hypothetical protein ACM3S2_09600 [Ignavibacteriales bacterium]